MPGFDIAAWEASKSGGGASKKGASWFDWSMFTDMMGPMSGMFGGGEEGPRIGSASRATPGLGGIPDVWKSLGLSFLIQSIADKGKV